jgi:hypothetical protein
MSDVNEMSRSRSIAVATIACDLISRPNTAPTVSTSEPTASGPVDVMRTLLPLRVQCDELEKSVKKS